jgi:RecB family exonuclease
MEATTMELRSLSASSAAMFEDCPSRWYAEYHGKADQIGSAPAKKGTVVHATLEEWVANGLHLAPPERPEQAIELIYSGHYEKYFSDTAEYDDGLEMVLAWLKRTDWSGRKVLSTEVKKSFPLIADVEVELAGPNGEIVPSHDTVSIPCNYIFDRVDEVQADEPTIEVVDYKTWRLPMSPETLRHKVQAKLYALAALLEFPWAERIWVTMDQLRHDPVSVSYKRRELEEFHAYLERLAERIILMDPAEAPEILNKDCKYCVRKLHCATLATNKAAGGTLGNLDDLAQAASIREKIAMRRDGLNALLEEVDGFILNDMKHRDEVEVAVPLGEERVVHVELSLSKRRQISAERAAKVVGPDIIARYGSITMGAVDTLLKKDNPELTDDQKAELAKLITVKWGDEPTPKIRIEDV